jgi:RNA recognition motif-containing protein
LFDIRRNREYMNIYVGNLAMETTGGELKQAFSVFGKVKYIIVMHDGNTNRYEAGLYAYIEMTMKSEGLAAINSLNGTIIKGRVINTIEALPLTAKKIQMSRRSRKSEQMAFNAFPQLHKN